MSHQLSHIVVRRGLLAALFLVVGCSRGPTPAVQATTSASPSPSATAKPAAMPPPDQAKKELEAKGLKLDEETFLGCAKEGDIEAVKLFLAAGTKPDAVFDGRTALYQAALHSHLATVELLLDSGADPNFAPKQGSSEGVSPLQAAAYADGLGIQLWYNGSEKEKKQIEAAEAVMRELVERGAVVENKPKHPDRGPLHLAAAYASPELIELLLSKGADPNRRDAFGDVPLTYAVETGNLPVVKLLLAKKADPKILTDQGQTVLFNAVDAEVNVEKVRECVALMIDLGVDVNKKDKYGKTALSIVQKSSIDATKKKDMIALLKSKGAK